MKSRNDIIAEARIAGLSDDELTYTGPGRTEGHEDRQLAVALAWMVDGGYVDEQSGNVDAPGGHFARIDRWLVVTDHVGFIHVTEFLDPAGAVLRYSERETEYAEWDVAEEE